MQILKLDTTDKTKVENYESSLYEAFVLKDKSGWIATHYQIIDDSRLRSRVPYKDQIIYFAEINNKIVCAGAMNFNYNAKLQLEDMGFKIQKNEPLCEGLTFFATDDIQGEIVMNLFSKITLLFEDEMRNKNINISYLTCARKVKALYSLNGFKKVAVKEIDGIKKYLMMIDLRTEKDTVTIE